MALDEGRYTVGKNNAEEIEFLAEAHGVVFPIKVSDFSSIELLSGQLPTTKVAGLHKE